MNGSISKERRLALKTVGVLGAGLVASGSLSNMAHAETVQHHHHTAPNNKLIHLAQTLHHCVGSSELCINHCMDMFKTGDTSLADCANVVQETMAFCAAHAKLASYDSKFLKEMCVLSIKVCAACEKECRKHAKKHVECKACADSCVACIKACEAYLT